MSGAMVATAVAVAAEVISAEVAFAIYSVNAVYQASQGNYIGAALSAAGAYGVGGGFSEGGFGSSFSGASNAAASSGTAFDAAAEAGADYGYNPWDEVAMNGWDSAAPGAAEGFGYSLGGEVYSPADLPFNPEGLDISGQGGVFNPNGDGLMNTSTLDAAGQTAGTGLTTTTPTPESSTYGAATGTDATTSTMAPNTTALDAGGGQSISGTTTGTLDTGTGGALSTPGTEGGVNWSETGGSTGLGMDQGSGGISGGLEYSPKYSGGTGWTEASGTTPGLTQAGGSTVSQYQPTVWDNITRGATTGANKMYDKFMENPVMNSIKAGGSLMSMYNSANAADQMKRAYQQSDPFGPQREYYQGLLKQSYADPSSIYKGAEYQSLQDMFMRDLAAKDAAAGRNSQYGARQAQAQNYFNTYLNNYRQGLQQAAGTGIAPNAAGAQLAMAQAQQRKNMYDSATAGLTSIFGDPQRNNERSIRLVLGE